LEKRLSSQVVLSRDAWTEVVAATWATGSYGIIPYFNDIRFITKDKVDEFINAYLSVNPR